MSTENHMKLSKRFGLNLRPFKKVTPKQQKIMQKVQKQQALKKKSNFGVQLEIKKSVAFLYGGLRPNSNISFSKEFSIFFMVSQNMVSFLEKRLDTVLVKNLFVGSFAHARQLISHQKVKVNGVLIQVPSFQLYPGDVISLDDEAQDQVRQTMRDFLNRQEEQSGLKNFSAKNEQDFTNTAVWYKTTYCEVNYKTLEKDNNMYFRYNPKKVHTGKFTKVFKR